MKRLNLVTKTLLFFSVLLFCAILFSGLFSVLTFYNIVKTVGSYSLEKNTVLVANMLKGKSFETICELTKSISNDKKLRITLIKRNGDVIIDSKKDAESMENHLNRPEISQALKNFTGTSVRYSHTLNESMVYAASSFLTNDNEWLIIRISTSLPELTTQFNSFIAILISIFVLMFIITLIISFYINSLMLKSISILTDAGCQWAKGKFDYRLPEIKDSSFSELANTMNHMAEDIQNMLVRLKKLEIMRKDFVANVSHELRTPITLIKGFTEAMLNDAPDDIAQQQEFLEIMNKNADRMELIIRDLLTLSTLENTESIRDEFIPVEAAFVVDTCISLFTGKAKRKNIRINSEVTDEIYALANSGLLETALGNLIDNAIKYSPDNTEIFVNAFKKDNMIYFTVKNTGNKIDENHQTRIFERFYRVDKARSKAVGGTGLGLAIVKHIALGHNGSCTVESNDEYTIFSLSIPSH